MSKRMFATLERAFERWENNDNQRTGSHEGLFARRLPVEAILLTNRSLIYGIARSFVNQESLVSLAAPSQHYENFPVASWLCPPALRPAISAIYWFARTADDLADEGDAGAAQRLEDLSAYRSDLRKALEGGSGFSQRWETVFNAVADTQNRHSLPPTLLHALLDAFEQDVRMTEAGQWYESRAQLLAYCARSAQPIGRLLLHLLGMREPTALAESDHICTALQLINFWQDLSVDLARRRWYIPRVDCERFGVSPDDVERGVATDASRQLVADLFRWAQSEMLLGMPLAHRIQGRFGIELRWVVQGGLAVLEKIQQLNHDTFSRRPKIGFSDAPRIAWRSLLMRNTRHGFVIRQHNRRS